MRTVGATTARTTGVSSALGEGTRAENDEVSIGSAGREYPSLDTQSSVEVETPRSGSAVSAAPNNRPAGTWSSDNEIGEIPAQTAARSTGLGEASPGGDAGENEGTADTVRQRPSSPTSGVVIAGLIAVLAGFATSRIGETATAVPPTTATTWLQSLVATIRAWAHRLAVLSGYSRYDSSDPLEHDGRETIFETVAESPGINLSSLVESTEMPASTVRYHVRILEHEDLLEAAKIRGRKRFFPPEAPDVELAAALEEEATLEVIDALQQVEPATGSALAAFMDKDPSTISHHLSRLSDAGLVERERDGAALVNSLSPVTRESVLPLETASADQRKQPAH